MMGHIVNKFLKLKHSFLYQFASFTWLLSPQAKFDFYKALNSFFRKGSQDVAGVIIE